jgi:hypothetical protein
MVECALEVLMPVQTSDAPSQPLTEEKDTLKVLKLIDNKLALLLTGIAIVIMLLGCQLLAMLGFVRP